MNLYNSKIAQRVEDGIARVEAENAFMAKTLQAVKDGASLKPGITREELILKMEAQIEKGKGIILKYQALLERERNK